MGTFGQRLRELRNQRGISQNELSKHIGVSKSSVNMYERGEREPGFETLEAIADFFNVNMDYLLGRELEVSLIGGCLEDLSDTDRELMLAEIKRMEGSGEKTAVVKTAKGAYFLFHFSSDEQEESNDE